MPKRSTRGSSSRVKWNRIKGLTKEGYHLLPPTLKAGRVWVYCPSYPFMPVRSMASELLMYCLDASHWREYQTGEAAPSVPNSS